MLPNQGDGTYRLHIYVDDADGHTTYLGPRRITCTNSTASSPFGTIDTPAQGETITGTAYLNFAWALTPQPHRIPINGSTLQVFIDDVPVGRPTCCFPRSDIQTFFPGYQNTDASVGYFTLDTTRYANGSHTIQWAVVDDAGRATGIGSRFFTIFNGSSVTAAPVLTAVPPASELPAMSVAAAEDLRSDSLPEVRVSGRLADPAETIRISMRDRIDVRWPAVTGARLTGSLIVNGKWRPLPIGSTLNTEQGTYGCQPAAGFSGTYELLFVRTGRSGSEKTRLVIEIED